MAILAFAILANYPFARPVSLALNDFERFSLTYHGSSHGARSPACGCLDYDPAAWRGVTFAYSWVNLGPFTTPSGTMTAYVLGAPFPGGVSYMIPFGFEISTELHQIRKGARRPALAEVVQMLPQTSSRAATQLMHSQDGVVTIATDGPIELHSSSETPVGAWLPLEGSTLTITNPPDSSELLRWRVREDIHYDPRQAVQVRSEVSPGDPEFVPPNVQHPIVDLIGTSFVVYVPPGSMLSMSSSNSAFQVPWDPAYDYLLIIRVPFSLRVGVLDGARTNSAELTPGYEGARSEHFFEAPTPEQGFVEAQIAAAPGTEERAADVIRQEPLIWIRGRQLTSLPGVYSSVQMLRPPVPALPGANIFGPIRTIQFHGAKGNVVVGADPMPSYAAPSNFAVSPSQREPDTDPPVPIRVTRSTSTFSSEFSTLANLTVNGQQVTTFESLLTGIVRDVANLTAFLLALAWAISRLVLVRRKTADRTF